VTVEQELLAAAIDALADLENLTSAEYAAGADQASRDALRAAIARARREGISLD
jgi:conjugal transfer/entry exclusion protein